MRNRRGMLLATETLKIVIAVISIGFLVYFLTSLYVVNVNKDKTREAEAILEKLGEEVNVLEEGGEKEFHLVNPSGWYLFSFLEDKPNFCAGKNCLCICSKVIITLGNRQIKECDKDGVCLFVDNLESFEEFKINDQMILINKLENKIGIKEK
jgi:hypothetical protein